MQILSCKVVLRRTMHNVKYCVHILCLINPLNLSNIYSAKNNAKVNSTTKISPHFCPLRPQIALYPSRAQGCYQRDTHAPALK